MPISRRRFLGGMGAGLLASVEASLASGLSPSVRAAQVHHFAYISSEAEGAHGIHVFQLGQNHWRHIQFVPSVAPASLALSPDRTALFVANRVRSVEGLPTGSVESYRINDAAGTLTLIARQPLALSAMEPEHFCVSPDGRLLAVAATGGGSYNILPIAADRSLLPVCSLRKELGASAHPEWQSSAPRQVIFDGHQRLLGADAGLDTVSIFEDDQGLLSARQRLHVQPGGGLGVMSFDRTGKVLCTGTNLQPFMTAYRYEGKSGRLEPNGRPVAHSREVQGAWRALLAHPEADLMLGAWSDGEVATLTCWRVEVLRGALTRASEWTYPGDLSALTICEGEPSLVVALDRRNGEALLLRWHAGTGEISSVGAGVAVPQPRAVAVRRVGS